MQNIMLTDIKRYKPYRHQQHLPKKFSKRLWNCTDGNSTCKKYMHCSITAVLLK